MASEAKYRFKELRLARGLTQQNLADLAGLSKSYVSQLELGDRAPSSETLEFVADALGVPVASLLVTEHAEILEIYHQLPLSDRDLLMALARRLLATRDANAPLGACQSLNEAVTQPQ